MNKETQFYLNLWNSEEQQQTQNFLNHEKNLSIEEFKQRWKENTEDLNGIDTTITETEKVINRVVVVKISQQTTGRENTGKNLKENKKHR